MIDTKQDVSFYADFNTFSKLRTETKTNNEAALQKTAKQFESLFLNMMLQSMRNANNVFKEDSMINSDTINFYEGMFDNQLSLNLSGDDGIGLAKVIVQQLKGREISGAESNLDKISMNSHVPGQLMQSDNFVEKSTSSFAQPKDFVKNIFPYIKKHAEYHQLDAKILMAQAALETGWGESIISGSNEKNSHNLFNIKGHNGWHGEMVKKNVLEYKAEEKYYSKESFKSYDSYEESIKDYIDMIKNNPRYSYALQNTNNPRAYITSLQEAGYATDPKYADKVMSVYNSQFLSDLN